MNSAELWLKKSWLEWLPSWALPAPAGAPREPFYSSSGRRRCLIPRPWHNRRSSLNWTQACECSQIDLLVELLKKPAREEIPRKTIYRLSLYLRCLARLKENRIETVSSETLAKVAGVKPTQLRKDLTYLGQFGTRGLGYEVAEISRRISAELGTTRLQPVILVGVGHLGLALLSYRGFEKEGFEIVAAFDIEPDRPRDKQIGQPILPMDELPRFVQEHQIKMAILTVPAAAAQEVANQLIASSITGILNFAPLVLHVPEEVMVNNVNLAIELENLSYFIQE
jgi:redox-sensing transcriptional repressor